MNLNFVWIQYRLKAAKANKTPPWEDFHLDKVLKKLKAGKAMDADKLVNELFMIDNIGSDLKKSLKILLNKMKNEFDAPKFINACNIFSLYKGKNDRASLENDRGIFIMSIIRMIRDIEILIENRDQ